MKFCEIPTPAFVIDKQALIKNLEVLNKLENKTGAKVLLAQKAFSAYKLYPIISKYLSGTTSSGLFEARLANEHFKGENHVFSPAYTCSEMLELCKICDHISFNSFSQLNTHRGVCEKNGVEFGLRLNPEISTQKTAEIYDPCAKGSRLGITLEEFNKNLDCLSGVSGLHFHTLCEQNSDALVKTFEVFEKKFGKYLSQMKWLNLGGGHHITKDNYDINALEQLINYIKGKYNVKVYLEPGEAIALNAGYFVSTVLDKVENFKKIAILDCSAACHMPDVLEMPYVPPLKDSGKIDEKAFNFTIAGRSCLAGDVIGDYSFDKPLEIGDRLVFEDMAIYSMVKTNTFNGMPLPSIWVMNENGDCELINAFDYSDFKERL